MKKDNTSLRLKKLMYERHLKQVDILNACIPYCQKYNVKMNKSDISQYVSGKVEPNQDKLFILGNALNVSEAWLMGYDVPMERSNAAFSKHITANTIAFEITGRSLRYSPLVFDAICQSFEEITSYSSKDVAYTDGDYTFSSITEMLKSPNISYNKKASAIRTVIDMVLIDTKKNHIEVFYTEDNDNVSSLIERLNSFVQKLNYAGIKKVVDYTMDLSNLGRYTKSSDNYGDVNTTSNLQNNNSLIPIAAHNDHLDEEGELENIRADLAKLKKPNGK